MTQKVPLDLLDLGGGQLAGMRNKIINGKMEIAQRGTSFASLADGYSVDRWYFNEVTAGVVDVAQNADAPSTNEFQNSLRVTVTTADASIGSEFSAVIQRVEGFNARDLIGRTFTLSFWVRSSKTGVHCVSFRNSAADRSYVLEYTVNAANTWEQKSVTVSGGLITAGTWNWTNGNGVSVAFTQAAGGTFQTTAGAWQTGNFYATVNQVNCLDTIGNIFAITGVQLEVGSVATPFEHRPFGAELALCQRYYEITPMQFVTGTTTAGVFQFAQSWVVQKRAAPTITYTDGAGNASKYSGVTAGGSTVPNVSFSSAGVDSNGGTMSTVRAYGLYSPATYAGFGIVATGSAEL